ncbi:MAG: deoxyribose-phosphate aldolase [Bacteroidales bacterium]|jgi:deoxyribose-phosphate aldolase|nr:deoxyribose-phosphate aldolase [Bacteroidales bacterium]
MVNIKSFIDLTTLEGADTKEKVVTLCNKAKHHQTAAICVYPPFAKIVREQLAGTTIQTACVAGAFPSGQSPIHVKTSEVAYAIEQGAQEIDMVISRGTFLEGDYATVGAEIKAIKEACGAVHLKVILETGELQTPENIKLASEIAIANGADFIKTSTGKIPVAATPEAATVMLHVIKEHYQKTGNKIGFKPAGGISKPADAEIYVNLVRDILGEEWLRPELFRIGASRLVDAL